MFSAFFITPVSLFSQLTQQGIKAVSFENIAIINEALTCLKLEGAEKLILEKKINNCRHRKKPISTKQKNIIEQYRKGIWLLRMVNAHASHRQACMQFNDNTWWAQLSEGYSSWRERIRACQTMWESHGQYGQYSTPDLIQVYEKLIPVFAQWLNLAKVEVRVRQRYFFKRLPKHLVEEYQAYLNGLSLALEREKEAIRASLIARIRVGIEHNNLALDDVAYAMQSKIKALISNDQLAFPAIKTKRHTLWAREFDAIQQIIASDGDVKQKAEFKHLLYSKHRENDQGLVERKTPEGKVFWVPNAAGRSIPSSRPFFTRLPQWIAHSRIAYFFHNQKIAYEFFQHQHCQYLLAIHTNEQFQKIRLGQSWRELLTLADINQTKKLFAYLKKEAKRITDTQQSLVSYAKTDTMCLLFAYEHTLNQFTKHLLNKEITMIEKILKEIRKKIRYMLVSALELKMIDQLIHYISSLAQEYQYAYGHRFSSRIAALKKERHELFVPLDNLAPEDNALSSVLNKTTEGDALSLGQESITVLASAQKQLSEHSDQYSNEEVELVTTLRVTEHALYEGLEKELNTQPLELSQAHFAAHLESLKNAYLGLHTLAPKKVSSAEFQRKLYIYFYRLICAIENMQSKEHYKHKAEMITSVIDLLSTLPHGDPILAQVLKNLDQALKKMDLFDWEVFLYFDISAVKSAFASGLKLPLLSTPSPETEITSSKKSFVASPNKNTTHQGMGLQELSMFNPISARAHEHLKSTTKFNHSK